MPPKASKDAPPPKKSKRKETTATATEAAPSPDADVAPAPPKRSTSAKGAAKPPAKASKFAAAAGGAASAALPIIEEEPVFDELGHGMTSIVGIRYYTGIINKREQMILVRQPTNQYDRNAIAVHNSSDAMVGHIPKEVAAVLAPLMDAKIIELEAYTQTSVGGTFKVPLLLVIFAQKKNHEFLIMRHFSNPVTNPIQSFSTAPIELPSNKKIDKQHFDEAMARALQLLDVEDKSLHAAMPSSRFNGTLLPFQQYALSWMLRREVERPVDFAAAGAGVGGATGGGGGGSESAGTLKRRRSTKSGSAGLDMEQMAQDERADSFFWIKEKNSKTGATVYTNSITNHQSSRVPTLAKGGLLADDAGLGKTVTVMALLSHAVGGPAGPGGAVGAKPSRSLIVCPAVLTAHWEAHIKRFLPDVAALVYTGSETAAATNAADVVITTYTTVRAEHGAKNSPIFAAKWGRVVLDEATNIKSPTSQISEACAQLRSDVRWCITGAPLVHKFNDLYGIVKFVGIAPFDRKEYWTTAVAKPMRASDPRGPVRLGVILRHFCLRRTAESSYEGKPLLTLPAIDHKIVAVNLNVEERLAYNEMRKAAREEFIKCIGRDGAQALGQALLLQLRQFCDDPTLVPRIVGAGGAGKHGADLSPSDDAMFRNLLLTAADSQCPICIEDIQNAVVTKCKHLFCEPCLDQLVAAHHEACPLCRTKPFSVAMKQRDIAAAEAAAAAAAGGGGAAAAAVKPSSKVAKVVELVAEAAAKGEKVVVFSQWTSVVDRLAAALAAHPLASKASDAMRTRVVVSTTSVAERQDAMKAFEADAETKVLLLSKLNNMIGVNLTAAATIIVVDPWWNADALRQVVQRVHRIGQKKPVTVLHTLVQDSVEAAIFELQQVKQMELEGRSRAERAAVSLSVAEIRALLSHA